jgi:hypothetical protein
MQGKTLIVANLPQLAPALAVQIIGGPDSGRGLAKALGPFAPHQKSCQTRRTRAED